MCQSRMFVPFYTVLTMMLFFIVQAVANKLFFHEVILGDKRAFALYFLLQTILHFALLMIVMCIALVIRNNVVSIVIGICLCMNALIIFYSFIDRMLAKVGLGKFSYDQLYCEREDYASWNRDYIGNGSYFFAGWICICNDRSLF